MKMFGAKLNRQPGPLNEEALQMLRDEKVKKYTNVVTSDDFLLGTALRILLRQDEINPDLKLYAAYLQVNSRDLGTHFYIPTEFIKEYDPAGGKLILSVPLEIVEDELFSREPTFIAGDFEKREELA
jgi:hypothetical protein